MASDNEHKDAAAVMGDLCGDPTIADEARREVAVAESATTIKGNLEVGDAARMREACDFARDMCADAIHLIDADSDRLTEYLKSVVAKMNAALSAPPRNCDVGTADEQAGRYLRYCDRFTTDATHCETCPCCGEIQFGKCEFAWAQMPYEEGGAK